MEGIKKFVTSIKKRYKERRINREHQWPPCHSNKLVRLELVEGKKGEGYFANRQRGREVEGNSVRRTPLAYSDLFKVDGGAEDPGRKVRKILVEGDAGIGKTTLSISVCEEWANGKLFQQFELILLLPLRTKAVATASSLSELLKVLHPNSRLCNSVASYLEDEAGENVLVIADGWDELSESEQQEGSFLYQLLFDLFPFMSVMVTSRPTASTPLHYLPNVDRFVEVLGFSKEHIVEFIHSEFATDQEKAGCLIEQLENNPLVESVCSVPLNCAIICYLWDTTFEEDLPTTMTELYTKLILKLVLRNIRKVDGYRSVLNLTKFDALPADLQQSWWLLCEFAFHALEKDQLVFSQEELEVFFHEGLALDRKILCFGVLQSAESIGLGKSFHFLHLTFQEYLGALHLARQPMKKQLDFFMSLDPKDLFTQSRFAVITKFLFGLLGDSTDIVAFILQIFDHAIASNPFSAHPDILSLCHCAFEAQNSFIYSKVIQYLLDHPSYPLVDIKTYFGYPHTAHDCAAVLYVLDSLSEECFDVVIDFGNCGVRENQIMKLIDILACKKRMLQTTVLNLSGSSLSISGLKALENAVCNDLLTNVKWLYLAKSLTSDPDVNATWLTAFIEAVLTHCPHLKVLDLSDNILGVSGALAVSRISRIKEPNVPKYVCLNKISLEGDLAVLTESLKVVSSLELSENDISATGISFLAEAVCEGKVVIEYGINLSDNMIGLEGTVAIGRMLSSSCCQLVQVILSRCELTTVRESVQSSDDLNVDNTAITEAIRDTGQQLCQMLQSSTITNINLDGNSFTGVGIQILAGFIHLCPCLQSLSTGHCDFTSDDIVILFNELTQFEHGSLLSELNSWKLHSNQIDDNGVHALLDHLFLFPCLWVFNHDKFWLSYNPISSEMMKKLDEKLSMRRQEVFMLLQSTAVLPFEDQCEELNLSESAIAPPPSDQLTGQTLSPELDSKDDTESMSEAFTLLISIPLSLFSTTLPQCHIGDIIPYADQLEGQQLLEGAHCDAVQGTSLDALQSSTIEFIDLNVEDHSMTLIKWMDENEMTKELRIYSKIAHKWRQIASLLGLELGEIESVEENHHRNNYRITAVLRRWFENAKNLVNARRYPKSWLGLINLLEDAELGEIAEELKRALSSPYNSVRGTI